MAGDPDSLAVSIAGNDATLTWDASPTDDVVDYTIHRRHPSSGGLFIPGNGGLIAAGITDLMYVDNDLLPGTYDWQVFGRIVAATPSPVITSPNNASFGEGDLETFTVVATGTPPPTFSVSGTLPTGVTFNGATGVLSGTPTVPGTYLLVFTATNGVLPDDTQNFTLTVTAAIPWSPLDIPGVVCWGDAADLASLAVATGVGDLPGELNICLSANDKTGNGHGWAVPPSGTQTPSSEAYAPKSGGSINGHNALDFGWRPSGVGLGSQFKNTFPSLGVRTFLLCWQRTGASGIAMDGDATNRSVMSFGNKWQLYAGVFLDTGVTMDTAVHSLAGVFDGASSKYFLDGVQIGTTGNAGSNSIVGSTIGGDSTSLAYGGSGVGLYGEWAVVPGDISATPHLAHWTAYCASKWGSPA